MLTEPTPVEPIAVERPGVEALDDRVLVELARDDADAFAELYRRHVPRVFGFAYRRTGSAAVAEDVTSAAFERALRSLDRFAWRGGGFGAWIMRIAGNELVEHYRRDARERRRVEAVAGEHRDPRVAPPEDAFARDLACLRDAITRLNPRYQKVVSLRYLAGLTADEAAEAMGCTKAVLAVTLHRALRALRRALQDTGGGE